MRVAERQVGAATLSQNQPVWPTTDPYAAGADTMHGDNTILDHMFHVSRSLGRVPHAKSDKESRRRPMLGFAMLKTQRTLRETGVI